MKWKTETRKVKDLKEYPKNARSLSKTQGDQLRESLTKFGLCEPIVINTDDTIIGGHQRLRTLKKMGSTHVEVTVPYFTLSEKEVEELNIRLNKNTGDWDWDTLANEWEATELLDWGFDPTDLQLGDEEETTTEKPSKYVITLTFESEEESEEAEPLIAQALAKFTSVTIKK